MNKLISYTITKIEPEKKLLVVDVKFSNSAWDKTKRMHYIPLLSREEWEKSEAEFAKGMGEGYVKAKYPKEDEFIKSQILTWATAFIAGKELEVVPTLQPETKAMIGKQIEL